MTTGTPVQQGIRHRFQPLRNATRALTLSDWHAISMPPAPKVTPENPVSIDNDLDHHDRPPMPSMTFELHGEYVGLNLLLKLAGLCDSGGAGKHLVASGVVEVDGVTELRKTRKVRAGQVVRLGGTEVHVCAATSHGVD